VDARVQVTLCRAPPPPTVKRILGYRARNVYVVGIMLAATAVLFGFSVILRGLSTSDGAPLEGENRLQTGKSQRIHAPNIPGNAQAATHTPPSLPSCNAHAEWSDQKVWTDPEEHKATFLARVRSWSRECRETALHRECHQGCDEFLSGMVIEAAPDEDEKRKLTRFRHDRNVLSVDRGRRVLAKVRALYRYAISTIRSPRSSHYSTPNASSGVLTKELVAGNPCLNRVRKDTARIQALYGEVDSQLPGLPQGFVGLRAALIYARSCLDCGDDRSGCADMLDQINNVAAVLAEREKLIAADKKAFAASRP
jgi:hypothetical protein